MTLRDSISFSDILTFGETMVLVAAPGEREKLEFASSLHVSIGGAESNCSIALARLGHSVCWVSRLGNDPFGIRILKTLRGEGIDVSRVEMSEIEPTGIMFKEPGSGNSSRIFYYRKNSAASHLNREQFDGLAANYLFVTGITPALSQANRELTLQIVDRFRNAGSKIVFDPNMRFKLWNVDAARPVFLELAKRCDIIVPSLVEAEILTGTVEPEMALEKLRQIGPPQIVIKGGAQGAWYADNVRRGFCPCFPAIEIDPVGAGDAFCAGLISGLLDGLELPEAVTRGAALGALTVSTFGDYHGAPDRVALQNFLVGNQLPGR